MGEATRGHSVALQASHVIIIIGIKRLQQGDQMIAQVADKTVRSVA